MNMGTLSQQDIDSLLQGGTPASTSAPKGPDVQPYNFLRPPRISKERRAIIEAIHARFALNLQSFLSSRLRQSTDVTITSVEQATFAEFVFSLGNPCASFIFRLGDATGTQAALDLGTDLAYHIVDRLFGGPGESRDVRRPLTSLEQMVVKGIAERSMAMLRDAWGDYLPMQPSYAGFESTPETLQIASREDNVLVANIEVRSTGCNGIFTICTPLLAFEAFLQEKSGPVVGQQRGSNPGGRQLVERNLRRVLVPVLARFPSFRLRARDVAALRVGQVIHTGQALDTAIDVLVNGRRRFAGGLGQSRGFLGVRISATIADAPADGKTNAPRGRVLDG